MNITSSALPSLFVPHGAPTFLLRPGAAGDALIKLGSSLPRPRAVIIVSAHWDTAVPTVGFAARPETIHDFYGFPRELYDIRYPATGCEAGSKAVLNALKQAGFPAQADLSRGLDHGAWTPLALMYPEADIPVLPLSIQSHLGPEHHYRLGLALGNLSRQGFLILASGNLTHNLSDYQRASISGGQTPAYVRPFADWFWAQLQGRNLEALLSYRQQAPDASRAHPADEHLLPFYVALGAGGIRSDIKRWHAGIDEYVLAMDIFSFQSTPNAH